VTNFPVLDVSTWVVAAEEPVGLDEKVWLIEPAAPDVDAPDHDPIRWLFKPRVQKDDWFQGEDWSEKLASEFARLLGVPCARVELAIRGGELGSISLNLRPDGWVWRHGSELLQDRWPDYRSKADGRQGHSLENIREVLAGHHAPAELDESGLDAFGAFVGFLVLDAWIANRDRHDQNWAVLHWWNDDEPRRLAGSYDHASSLGFNLRDSARERRLRGVDPRSTVESFATGGTAWRFEHASRAEVPTLVALAGVAITLAGPAVRAYWLDRLARVTSQQVSDLVDKVPGLSDATRTFILELTAINRRRLLDEC
jgi:hypothetical protein